MTKIVDYSYYTDNYSVIDEALFNKLNMQSQSIILNGIIHKDIDYVLYMLDEEDRECVKNAICSQISFMSEIGGTSVVNGENKSLVTSENYGGSYSYSKQDNKAMQFMRYVNGIPIAPMVYIDLAITNLLYAGVDLNYEP